MKKLILIIMFLLLCPSLILAEEETSFIQNEDDIRTSESIAMDMFYYDIYEEYGLALRLWSFLAATGHDNLAEEVSKDVKNVFDDSFFPTSFISTTKSINTLQTTKKWFCCLFFL